MAGIHRVFRGLKFESDADVSEKLTCTIKQNQVQP